MSAESEQELTTSDFNSYSEYLEYLYGDIPYMYKDEYGVWWDTRRFAENSRQEKVQEQVTEEKNVTVSVNILEQEFIEMLKGLVVILVIGMIVSKFQ